MKAAVIVAADVPGLPALNALVEDLPPGIEWIKVGLELFCAEGPESISILKEHGKKIFLDLKLHDIPRTVARAVGTAAAHGVDLMTVHACGGKAMLQEAAQAANGHTRLIAVTTLTSLDKQDLLDLGIQRELKEQARALGRLAVDSGIDGLVTSVLECAELRTELGPDPLLVTPGIRLPDNDAGDQKRVATPQDAVHAGATHLVVGRPIVQADDRHEAALRFLESVNQA